MPKSVWERAGDEARARIDQAKDYAAQAETKADSFLMKLVKSHWTWLILGSAAGLFLVAVLA